MAEVHVNTGIINTTANGALRDVTQHADANQGAVAPPKYCRVTP